MTKESQSKLNCNFLTNEDLLTTDFNIVDIDANKIVCKQSELYEGLKIIVEGECYVSCDPEQIRDISPQLMIDYRKPVVNIASLKESLNKLIIPSLKDHDLCRSFLTQEPTSYKSKYIRTLTRGDKIGDFECCLKLEHNLFTVTNSATNLKLAHIPLALFPKILKHNQQFFQNISETILLKCTTYTNQDNLAVLFDNIQTKIKSLHNKKSQMRPKSAMTDFEATLKLYEQDVSALVPSYIPNSMNMMWKMKLSEEYWRKKIEERKNSQEKENEIKINYFRTSHHQTARSRKTLEKLKKKENPSEVVKPEKKQYDSTMLSVVTSARLPINHPSVASIWTVLKAMNRFKHNPNQLKKNKIAKSKSQIIKEQKRLSEVQAISDDEIENEVHKEFDFDAETSDRNLSSIEQRMRKFVNSLPKTSKSEGISSLKRFAVDGRSIPQLGGTVLVRLKTCNPPEEAGHIQHHILPKDALSTLQKYRSSMMGTNNQQ